MLKDDAFMIEIQKVRAKGEILLLACKAALEDLEDMPGRHEPLSAEALRRAIAQYENESI